MMTKIQADILNGKVEQECTQCQSKEELALHPTRPEIWCRTCWKNENKKVKK